MKTLLAILLLWSTANADVIRIPDSENPRRCCQPHRECQPVTIRRTRIFVDECGREVRREVSYRRVWLCDETLPRRTIGGYDVSP